MMQSITERLKEANKERFQSQLSAKLNAGMGEAQQPSIDFAASLGRNFNTATPGALAFGATGDRKFARNPMSQAVATGSQNMRSGNKVTPAEVTKVPMSEEVAESALIKGDGILGDISETLKKQTEYLMALSVLSEKQFQAAELAARKAEQERDRQQEDQQEEEEDEYEPTKFDRAKDFALDTADTGGNLLGALGALTGSTGLLSGAVFLKTLAGGLPGIISGVVGAATGALGIGGKGLKTAGKVAKGAAGLAMRAAPLLVSPVGLAVAGAAAVGYGAYKLIQKNKKEKVLDELEEQGYMKNNFFGKDTLNLDAIKSDPTFGELGEDQILMETANLSDEDKKALQAIMKTKNITRSEHTFGEDAPSTRRSSRHGPSANQVEPVPRQTSMAVESASERASTPAVAPPTPVVVSAPTSNTSNSATIVQPPSRSRKDRRSTADAW